MNPRRASVHWWLRPTIDGDTVHKQMCLGIDGQTNAEAWTELPAASSHEAVELVVRLALRVARTADANADDFSPSTRETTEEEHDE